MSCEAALVSYPWVMNDMKTDLMCPAKSLISGIPIHLDDMGIKR